MTFFRKSLRAELGERAQRLADIVTHERAQELTGAAHQYAGDAGSLAVRTGRRAGRAIDQFGGQASGAAARASQQASHAAARTGEHAMALAALANKQAITLAALTSKHATAIASRAGKQVRKHPRTSIAVGAGLGIAALTAAWLLRRHQIRQAEFEHDEHDPTRYRASNDAGDALDGSGEDNPIPGETGLY